MGILSYQNFCEFVAKEFQTVVLQSGSERRIGVCGSANDVIFYIQRDLNTVNNSIARENLTYDKAVKTITELTLETTSLLYAIGADHILWRHWSSLTAFGMFLQKKFFQAAQYATLAGEWDFIKILPSRSVNSQQISDRVLSMLLSGNFDDNVAAVENAIDEEDNAWLELAKSIPAKDHSQTEAALKKIANFWIAEDDDWVNFHPRSYPDFETPVCAAAALARHYGFIPTSLTPDEFSFLEAGLAVPEPSPMFPDIFSLPESSKISAV